MVTCAVEAVCLCKRAVPWDPGVEHTLTSAATAGSTGTAEADQSCSVMTPISRSTTVRKYDGSNSRHTPHSSTAPSASSASVSSARLACVKAEGPCQRTEAAESEVMMTQRAP
jgi:hypothetical protein